MATLKDLLVNGNSNLLSTATTVNILPRIDVTYDLGSADFKWNEIYGKTIKLISYDNTLEIGSKNGNYVHIYSGTLPFAVNQTIVPSTTSSKDLGSTSLAWKTIYLANTTGSAYDNGLRLYNSGTLMGSIGVGSSGIGIYGNGNVYIRPVLNAATSGFKVTTTNVIPASNNTIDLGEYNTTNNTLTGWKDVHATLFVSRAAAATTGGTTGFTIKDTSNNIYGTFRIYTAGTTTSSGLTILTLGNSKSATTTANAAGCLTIYGTDQAYTDFKNALTGSTNRTMYLPNYAGNGYLTHTASASAVGGDNTPVYVAANGRITAVANALTSVIIKDWTVS